MKDGTPRRDSICEFFTCVTENFELTFDNLVAICNDGVPCMRDGK